MKEKNEKTSKEELPESMTPTMTLDVESRAIRLLL
jgi:hypothetical protein